MLKNGKKYELHHRRLGNAVVIVMAHSDEWVVIQITSGVLGSGGTELCVGDIDTLRRVNCKLIEVKE